MRLEAPWIIRLEAPDDVAAIHYLNAAAFGRPNEAMVVDALRANGKAVLSLIADLEGQVVGHILFSPMTVLEPNSGSRPIALGPLAVLPEKQRRGIGSALVRQGIESCRELGFDIMLLLGEPDYYSRFGFLNAAEMGLRLAARLSERAMRAFQAIELRPMPNQRQLTLQYSGEFAVYT